MPSPGIWEAEIGFFHEGKHDAAVAYLAAFHQHCPPKNQLIAREELFKVGVDSGQARCVRQAVLPCQC